MEPRQAIVITTTDGREVRWHKGGKPHSLTAELAPVWVANFKPGLFQIAADGQIVPRGTAGAVDIAAVRAEAAGD